MKIGTILFLGALSTTIVGCMNESNSDQKKVSTEKKQESQVDDNDTGALAYDVVLDSHYPPFEYSDENGNLVGYDIDLMKAIASKAGFEVKFNVKPFNQILSLLEKDNYDIAISAVKYNDSRQEKFSMSDPYLQTHEGFLVNKDSPYTTLQDLEGKTIAVLDESHQHEEIKKIKDFKTVPKDTIFLAFQSLINGEADAIYSEDVVQHFEMKLYPEHPLRFLKSQDDMSQYVIYSNKKNEELIGKINLGLDRIKKDGQYNAITEKWFGDYAKTATMLQN